MFETTSGIPKVLVLDAGFAVAAKRLIIVGGFFSESGGCPEGLTGTMRS
jgi:hypothetical protein